MSFNHKRSLSRLPLALLVPATLLSVSLASPIARAETSVYNPIPIPSSNEITDTLSEKDIPTGAGGFARDYVVSLQAGDNVVIDLTSDDFDTIVSLIAPDGSTFGENDDGPDGSTNSMLFARITQAGDYIIRVRPYGGQGMGAFTLKVTRLRPV